MGCSAGNGFPFYPPRIQELYSRIELSFGTPQQRLPNICPWRLLLQLLDWECRMEKVFQAYRSPDDEHLFSKPTDDLTIVPDRITAAVEGYFRIPAVWIGEEPDPQSVELLNPDVYHAVMLKKTLGCGIEVWVLYDGTFLFDFSSCPLAPQVKIPGYRTPEVGIPYRMPKESFEAEEISENYAILRAQVMNVHQACLSTSEWIVKCSRGEIGFPLTSWNTHKALTLESAPPYRDDTEDVRALARNVLNNKYRVQRQKALSRRILGLDVVEHSLGLLDTVLSRNDETIVRLIEVAYIAACRRVEKRFGEAVVLAWAVCEQLVSSAWTDLRLDIKDDDRMTRNRKKKLESRDYSISVIVEILEMQQRLDHGLYQLLECVRKTRNDWVHRMRVPCESDASDAIRAVEELFLELRSIRLSLNSGGRGGVPSWNVWIWNQVSREQ